MTNKPSRQIYCRLRHLGVFKIAGAGFASREIVREVIQFVRNAAQYLLDVRLDGYICQSSRMIGLLMIIAWVTHTDETPLSEERHPPRRLIF